MRSTVALYPFCAELLPVVKHFEELQKEYTITRLLSPCGLGLVGKDAGYARNHPDLGIIVSYALDMDESSWDTLLVVECVDLQIVDSEIQLEDIMARALKAGKKISYFALNEKSISPKIQEYLSEYPSMINLFIEGVDGKETQMVYEHFDETNIPVILVGGLLTEADVFEVLIQLAICMRKNGIHPLVLTRNPIGKMFDFYEMGHIFNNKNLSESEKIIAINLLTRNLEITEMPDVILLEAPDAIMQFSNVDPNGFGIKTYMVCRALSPDYLICSVPWDLGVGVFVEAISSDLTNRLKLPISAIHISNIIVDTAELLQTRTISYAHSSLERVQNQLENEKGKTQIVMCNVIQDGVDEIISMFES